MAHHNIIKCTRFGFEKVSRLNLFEGGDLRLIYMGRKVGVKGKVINSW